MPAHLSRFYCFSGGLGLVTEVINSGVINLLIFLAFIGDSLSGFDFFAVIIPLRQFLFVGAGSSVALLLFFSFLVRFWK